jgi:hypothetical protein
MFHIKYTFNNQTSFIGITNSLRKIYIKVKVQKYLHRPITGPENSRFWDSKHMKVVRLSILRTGRLYPQDIFLVLISVRG